jgi:uncharacterized membrane protein
VIGTAILPRRKGTLSHQTMGWLWVELMVAVAVLAMLGHLLWHDVLHVT